MVKKIRQSRVAVLGAGSWGITLANVLHENKNKVILWEYDPIQTKKLQRYRTFITLKGYKIPKAITITNSLEEAATGADYIVVSVPSSALKSVVGKLSKININRKTVIVSTIKGFDQQSLMRPTELLEKHLGGNVKLAVLSGPSHAEEVVNRVPTAIVVATKNKSTGTNLQELFSNLYFRVYTSNDIKGVELGGALKNIIAIGSGIASGLGMGDNTKAALITRGNAEITRLGIELGAKRKTFGGLSGIGDLIVTCFSEHSRNFRFGKYIGQGYSIDEALKKTKTTAEGVYATQSCYKLSKKHKIQMPVCKMIYQVLYNNKPVEQAWKELMSRPLKSEYIEKRREI